ncbi:caspase, EACC1-associated type [Streptomyces sp. NEAU-NA10]|uniref:caspase, EACC1-associated type n=1 Tax=Streptomyces sp. NEAU-NA10 TaxID=3416050 RepID=UPI003CC6B89E
MPGLPDPSASAAVLIGTSAYRNLPQLPAVENNTSDLAAVLRDATVWGLPEARCRVIRDPSTPQALLDPVYELGAETTDTLLVYYCGHGLRDSDTADLYLALTDSRDGAGHTATAYRYVRSALRSSVARRKIVILDCCFSGRATGMLADTEELAAQAVIDGAYVLTASPRDHFALAPEGEPHTAFTGELLHVLRNGIQDAPETLDLETLYRELASRLLSKNRPRPQRSQENDVGRLPLVRNRARATTTTAAGPVIDIEVQTAMMATGLHLARLLRSVGRNRDALPILRMILQARVPEAEGDSVAVHLELAELLTESGQDKEAIETLEAAFRQTHKRFGPEALAVCRRLAELLQAAGNHRQACDVLRHALDSLDVSTARDAELSP